MFERLQRPKNTELERLRLALGGGFLIQRPRLCHFTLVRQIQPEDKKYKLIHFGCQATRITTLHWGSDNQAEF